MEVTQSKTNFENIPAKLKSFHQWVTYKSKELIKGEKPTKIPIDPKTGKYAKTNDPQTWGSFEDTLKSFSSNGKKLNGIGFVVSNSDPFTGIDLDHCKDPQTGIIEPWALSIVEALNSYGEITPSGTGLRIFVEGKLPETGRKKGNIEAYSSTRFLTVTGNHLEATPTTIEERQKELDSFYQGYFGEHKPQGKTTPQPSGITPGNSTPILSDQEFIEKASQSKGGDRFQKLLMGDFSDHPSWSEADLALCSMLAFWTGNNPAQIDGIFRQSGLMRDKWDEKHFGDGQTYGQHTIQKAIEGTVEVYTPPTRQPFKNSPGPETISSASSQKEVCAPVIRNLDFPRETIGGLAGRFAEVHSAYLESPYSFFVFDYLTCLGNLIGDRVTLVSSIEPQPRFYTVTLGQSGDDRKSEAIKKTLCFFQNTFAKGEFNICQGVGSAEGLALKLGKIEQNPKRLLLAYDEAKAFVSKARIDGSTLLPCVNTFFESNQFHSATKSHDIEIDNAYLSFLAASTQETFEKMWTSDFLDIGFINRLWLVYDHAERRFSIPREVPSSDLEPMRKKLIEILSGIPGAGFKLDINEDAREIFDAWYLSDESHKSPLSKRLDTYGLRLMILLAVNVGASTINAQISENVVKLLQWQLQIRRECDVIDAETNVAKVEELIRRALSKGPLNPRELKQRVHYARYGIYIFQLAIDNLQKGEEVFLERQAKLYCLR